MTNEDQWRKVIDITSDQVFKQAPEHEALAEFLGDTVFFSYRVCKHYDWRSLISYQFHNFYKIIFIIFPLFCRIGWKQTGQNRRD